MKHRLYFLCLILLSCLGIQADVKLTRNAGNQQLLLNGQPFLVLGGELSNSAATSVADIDSVMPRMRTIGLNTVFAPVCWDLMEPVEGQFDFSLLDEMVAKARENDLHLIILWFGAWKNSMSCYAPAWFKRDTGRFPRAMTAEGKPLEIATAFSDNVLQADKRAFCKLMEHIKTTDATQNTILMVQVENEIGMLESARDYSPLARTASPPPPLQRRGELNNSRVSTDFLLQEEKWQAHAYARYVEQLAKAGKAVYDIPMYVNAAMNSRGRKPGQYPSAGPLAHLMDIWKQEAPHIDICAPDIYDTGFKSWVLPYKRPDNPFFTPETRLCENSGVRALYCFGEVGALAFSPFAVDEGNPRDLLSLRQSYDMIRMLQPLLMQQKQTRWGVLFSRQENDIERVMEDGNCVITARHYFTLPWDSRATDGSPWPEGGGIILRLAKDDYLIAGNGLVVTFQTKTEHRQANPREQRGEDGFILQGTDGKTQGNGVNTSRREVFQGKRMGILSCDEVCIDAQGKPRFLRRLNGDQDHQGRHARISCGEYKILRVKLYQY